MRLALIRPIVFSMLIQFIAFNHASGQIMSDPNRKSTPEFVRFFQTRFHDWYTKEVFSFESKFPKKDQDLIQRFLKVNSTFGHQSPTGFYRSFGYSVTFQDGVEARHTINLMNFENSPELQSSIRDVAAQYGADFKKLGIQSQTLGVRLADTAPKFTLLVLEPAIEKTTLKEIPGDLIKGLTGEVFAQYEFDAKKLSGVSIYRVNVETDEKCPPAIGVSQIDAMFRTNQKPMHFWNLRGFESRAVGGKGEQYVKKVRRGMNLQPGLVRWSSLKDFEIFYP